MSLTSEDKQWIGEQLAASEKRTVTLIEGLVGSLEKEMREGFTRVFDRFDAQAERMDRQGGLLHSGQTNLVRLNDWSEKMDRLLAARDKRIDELEARLKKLEQSDGGVQ
jgi:hypothetical protein